MDRAGLVGADGATHQGMYDIAYLRTLPNIVVMAPKDENELRHMLRTAVEYPGPAAMRYPRGAGLGVPLDPDLKPIPIGQAELLRDGERRADRGVRHPRPPGARGGRRARRGRHRHRGAERALREAPRPRAHRGARRALRRRRDRRGARRHGRASGAACSSSLAELGHRGPVRCLAVPDVLVEHGDPDRAAARLRTRRRGDRPRRPGARPRELAERARAAAPRRAEAARRAARARGPRRDAARARRR